MSIDYRSHKTCRLHTSYVNRDPLALYGAVNSGTVDLKGGNGFPRAMPGSITERSALPRALSPKRFYAMQTQRKLETERELQSIRTIAPPRCSMGAEESGFNPFAYGEVGRLQGRSVPYETLLSLQKPPPLELQPRPRFKHELCGKIGQGGLLPGWPDQNTRTQGSLSPTFQRPLTDKVGGSDNGPRQRSPELSDAELDAFLSGGSFTHRQNRVPAVGPIEPTREGELPQIAKFLVQSDYKASFPEYKVLGPDKTRFRQRNFESEHRERALKQFGAANVSKGYRGF